jgi:hypothetical protein
MIRTSVCSSTIIEDVLHHCQSDPLLTIAYFYFDFSDEKKRQIENLIRSLLTQFSIQCAKAQDALLALYTKNQNGERQPTADDQIATLKYMIAGFQHSYIILDALDECLDQEGLLCFIEEIVSWKIDNFHLLVTSRKQQAIEDCLKSIVSHNIHIQRSLVDADIRTHIREQLKNDLKLNQWPAGILAEIETVLMESANGM